MTTVRTGQYWFDLQIVFGIETSVELTALIQVRRSAIKIRIQLLMGILKMRLGSTTDFTVG